MRKLSALALVAIIFAGAGCATGPMPGGAGEVSGPLRSIEFYTKPPNWEEPFRASSKDRFFASDRTLYVMAIWTLPRPGEYVSKLAVRTSDGSLYRESEYPFRTEESIAASYQPIELPRGEAARLLGGRWQVEVSLDGKPVGRRSFTFEPSSIRLRTAKKLVIVLGTADPTTASGDWIWRHEYDVHESRKAALRAVGVVMRNELVRRFPHVDGPQDAPAGSEEEVILRPSLYISPNPGLDPRLEVEVIHLPTKTARKFNFKTSAGREGQGLYIGVAAADLAVQAASSPEVLDFLKMVTQAVPE